KARHRGLGLAVAYRILCAHRGGIQLEAVAAPATGTVARVVFPLAPARPAAVTPPPQAGLRDEAVRSPGLNKNPTPLRGCHAMPREIEGRLTTTPKPARTAAPIRELQSSGDIRILIVDDDPGTCSVIEAALSNRDFHIDAVSDPMGVESVLKAGNYHLIVLD